MRCAAMMLVVVAITGTVQAQTPSASTAVNDSGPASCVNSANTSRTQRWTALSAAERTAERSTEYLADARRSATMCGARFSLENTPTTGLAELMSLYDYVADTARSHATREKMLAATDLPMRDRAAGLVAAIHQEILAANGTFDIIPGAERYATMVDALPDSLVEFKFKAHVDLLGRYEYLDVDPGLQQHATAILALARRTGLKNLMLTAFESQARASADMLHPADAMKILDDAEKELGSTPQVIAAFKDMRNRYALIGTKAAPVTAQWWINARDSASAMQPGDGKVTIVEFTAHWCAPCRNSYPGMRELAQRFAGKPFDAVMATELYGYVGTRRPLTAEQEVEADHEYFAKEHALPYRVAINSGSGPAQPGQTRVESLDEKYRVGGIPQIMIVDKHGVIRQIVVGWDHGNTDRFAAFIDELLKEQ